jgi:Uma2 family endonuclease
VSSRAHAAHHTFRDYLALEASGNVKHEFYLGEIYAMAGGTPAHAALQVAVPSLLFPQMRAGACRAHGADLRVRVLATGLATYPDVTIVCGPRELDPEDPNTVVNPTVLVEVLSPSTAEYDRGGSSPRPESDEEGRFAGVRWRGEANVCSLHHLTAVKVENYKLIPSLRHYVLVSTDERPVDVWSRNGSDAWKVVSSVAGEVAELPAIGAALSVKELYEAAGVP